MFIQPVSMKCTQEQYEKDLKQPLLEMGYKESMMTDFSLNPIIMTNFLEINQHISNSNIKHKAKYNCYFIDHYNPELFLALAAMTKIKGNWGGKGEWIAITNNCFEKLCKKMFFYVGYRKATKEELINKFTKKEEMEKEQDLRDLLQSGNIVELRNGEMGIVIDTRMGKLVQFENSYIEVIKFDENLNASTTIHDIIKIRKISLGMQIIPLCWKEAPILWERKEPKEISLQELIKKAGYKAGEIKVKVQ